jgi:hypothetical protein
VQLQLQDGNRILVYFYFEFACEGVRFRVDEGVLGLGLIMVYFYYEFALRGS